MTIKLGILTTHPIQYQVPWFRALAALPDIDLTVFYCMLPDARQQGDGFGVEFQWDIPLLEGYKYEVLENVAVKPSVTSFWGCDTPGIYEVVRGRRDGGRRTEVRGQRAEDTPVEYERQRHSTGQGEQRTGRDRGHLSEIRFACHCREFHGVKRAEGGGQEGIEDRGRKSEVRRRLARDGSWGDGNRGWDAFIVNGWVVKSCLQALWACRRAGVPCIVRGESNALRSRAWWKGLIHRLLLSQYSAFLNIGKSNRDFYIANGVSEEKIFFAPYCIDNERFANQARKLSDQRAEIRKQWDIPKEAVCFLFCGKFETKKRPMDILRALHEVVSSYPSSDPARPTAGKLCLLNSVHVLMVGDGELRPACETFAKENRLPVTFAGFLNQSEIPRAYLVSDCIVLPSDFGETWGLVVNEAMACGLPAIVSDQVGCHVDLVIPIQTGAVFPFGDIRALSEMLISFASQQGKIKEMGEQAKKRVACYSYEEVVNGTIHALDYLFSRR